MPIRWRSYRLTKVRQAVGENARLGPLVFFESRTPTALGSNATSMHEPVPLPPLWLLLRQLTSTQALPVPPPL
jgi:hypothetical protein